MLDESILYLSKQLIKTFQKKGLMIATAESCTGGLIAASLTEIPGSSSVVDRGFVTYSNEAKAELLQVPMPLIQDYGAVSQEVAKAMVNGALSFSNANIALAVTGIAGPGGGSTEKPVGLVYIAVQKRGGNAFVSREAFGDIGRKNVRDETVKKALKMAINQVEA